MSRSPALLAGEISMLMSAVAVARVSFLGRSDEKIGVACPQGQAREDGAEPHDHGSEHQRRKTSDDDSSTDTGGESGNHSSASFGASGRFLDQGLDGFQRSTDHAYQGRRSAGADLVSHRSLALAPPDGSYEVHWLTGESYSGGPDTQEVREQALRILEAYKRLDEGDREGFRTHDWRGSGAWG